MFIITRFDLGPVTPKNEQWPTDEGLVGPDLTPESDATVLSGLGDPITFSGKMLNTIKIDNLYNNAIFKAHPGIARDLEGDR